MQSIYDFSEEELTAWLQERGEPRYRAAQVLEWVYRKRATGFGDMTSLPRDVRRKLADELQIGPLPIVSQREGRDSIKLLVGLEDGERVECVGMKTPWGGTACVSSQVGCPVGCAFCASGAGGLVRNLTTAEIVRQVLALTTRGVKVTNVVFMGMGEPLLNYEAVLGAVHTITSRGRMAIAPRHVTVGTAGVVPMIPRLARDTPAKLELAVSLGAPVDGVRRELVPGVARWPVAELMRACDEWTRLRGGQPVTYAYVLVAGVNDTLKLATQLAALLRTRRHHVNLIRMNPVEHCDLRPSSKEQTLAFARRLEERGINVSLRQSRGRDIEAACGQLRRSAAKAAGGRKAECGDGGRRPGGASKRGDGGAGRPGGRHDARGRKGPPRGAGEPERGTGGKPGRAGRDGAGPPGGGRKAPQGDGKGAGGRGSGGGRDAKGPGKRGSRGSKGGQGRPSGPPKARPGPPRRADRRGGSGPPASG